MWNDECVDAIGSLTPATFLVFLRSFPTLLLSGSEDPETRA